ncbi:hypothetical protein [Luteimonas sp. MC1825]|uniref:hypothetical protein n=1 Tax=Luteimonas sp. MC1825 TaxID=2761107 RepID=UPI00161014B1|nr:hypothetical protein [Luteimonas sp. MC1825]MBB6600496.1 hypothetical protein [Luteimonas sp. MC1825]QOC88158.1 hypothetical protein IDM46_13275 [Luteimonas sp. MC1825]
MRIAILALAVLGLAAGCGGGAEAPAAAAPSSGIDPAVARVVEDWPLPATQPGSALPDLARAADGRLLLAWTNSQPGRRHILQFSSYHPGDLRWQTAPVTIAIGQSMFVNWADTPHITATADGTLWAHWLQKNGTAPHAYDVALSNSRDGGMRWSTPFSPHDDGTASEHGFVSLWPQSPDSLGIAWLDGRNSAAAAAGGDASGRDAVDAGHADAHGAVAGGAMTLRAAVYGPTLRRSLDTEIDASVCDCCQTSVAVTARGPLLVYRGRTAGEVRDIMATRLIGDAWITPLRVHADDWTMPACPVNGPAVAAEGDSAVVAWYTAPAGVVQVRAAYSDDAGTTFALPVELDRGEAVQGRVDVALGDGQAWLLWLREDGDGQSLWLSRRSPDLATEYQRLQVARVAGRGRGTGFPKLQVANGVAHVVWTDVVDGVAQLRGARVLAR